MKKITRRQFLAATAVAGVSAALASCASSDSTSTSGAASGTDSSSASGDVKTLRIGWTEDIQTMDVHKTSANYAIPLNIFDRLFEIQLNDDGTTELVNSMVSDYTVSEDGMVYTMTLRDDLKTSDGAPYTASDVGFTFTRMLALPESVQTDFASAIVGAQDVIDGVSDTLEGFEVVDDTHFVITLGVPFAGFVYQLATASCSMLSQASVEAAGDQFGLDAALTLGTGPYMVTDWTANSQMVLELNPHYWGEKPSAEKVVYSILPDYSTVSMMFQSGEIDIIDCDGLDASVVDSTYKTAYADQVVHANRLGTTYFVLNNTVGATADVLVRQAIQYGVDRQGILDSVYAGDGVLVDGIYAYGLIGFTADNQGWLTYDTQKAKDLLAEAGYGAGDTITLEIASDASATNATALSLQIIQQNLAEVGITVEIKSYDEASWLSTRSSGEMQSFVATWTADYNDPDNFIYTFFGNEDKSKIRSINYQDYDVMARVEAARGIVDDAERLAEYAELERIIIQEDAAWVPLYSREHLFVVGDNVEKFVPHWAGYGDFSNVGVTLKA